MGGHGQLQKSVSRGLQLGAIPVALTCALHKRQLLADPCAEEESVLQTTLTVILHVSGGLISLYKPGGATLATTAIVQVFPMLPLTANHLMLCSLRTYRILPTVRIALL